MIAFYSFSAGTEIADYLMHVVSSSVLSLSLPLVLSCLCMKAVPRIGVLFEKIDRLADGLLHPLSGHRPLIIIHSVRKLRRWATLEDRSDRAE